MDVKDQFINNRDLTESVEYKTRNPGS